MEQKIIFDVKKVSKRFGLTKDTEVWALSEVSVQITQGEFTAIVGPSGSGKSTLLNIMSGLDHPSSGEVYLAGGLLSGMNGSELSRFRRDHIGFIFQAYNLIPVLTVRENIEYVMMLQGVAEKERLDRCQEILSVVSLEGKGDRLPSQLSGGQQQRVAVARAIVTRPNIVLADEPTANLDSKTGSDLVDMMFDLNEKYNTTFVFSTHDKTIMDKAKRLVVLKDGKIDRIENR